MRGAATEGEPLLGSGDIQSLADLDNSFKIVSEMKLVPFGKESIMRFMWIIAVPLAPLVLTMFSLEELFQAVNQKLFYNHGVLTRLDCPALPDLCRLSGGNLEAQCSTIRPVHDIVPCGGAQPRSGRHGWSVVPPVAGSERQVQEVIGK